MQIIFIIQKFIANFTDSMLSLLKIAITSSFFAQPPKVDFKNNSCIILGNGPSLSKTLENDYELLLNNDLMCVNQFVQTEYYEKLKPKFYVIVNDQYLLPNAVTTDVDKTRRLLFNNITTKTTWDLILFLPMYAGRSTFWKDIIKDNRHITVSYFNSTPVEGFLSMNNLLFKLNLGMPRPHNVLIPGIMQAINMGCKNIIITGADHSWHEEFQVDENNMFKGTDTYFYGRGNAPRDLLKQTGEHYKIHEAFRKFYLTFKGYHEIKSYADYRKITIFNASYKSYIDAFERKPLGVLLNL